MEAILRRGATENAACYKNGLELESVSLTGLDQTSKEFFNPDNAFDAEGLLKLTEAIELRRKKRNEIEQDTEVQVQRKNLDAQQQRLQISRDQEYAKLEHKLASWMQSEPHASARFRKLNAS